jgi:hypothetical protein
LGAPDRSQVRAAFYTRTRVTFDEALELHNRGRLAFDLALGSGALLAPAARR